MKTSTRLTVVALCVAACAAGAIFSLQPSNPGSRGQAALGLAELAGAYQFASADLPGVDFAKLESIVRADAATRFPNSRIEFGSVKSERGLLTMTVVFFNSRRQTGAFLYSLVPENHSWKISSARRLWFLPPSQVARGLRV